MPQTRTTQLDTLHADWKAHLAKEDPTATYVPDGIVDESQYAGIAFVLKDSNAWEHDLRELYRHPELRTRSLVWEAIDRCTRGLLAVTPDSFAPWEAIKPFDNSGTLRAAQINVKKAVGSGTIPAHILYGTASRDQEFIRRELAIIAPRVAICGGTWKPMRAAGIVASEVPKLGNDLLSRCYQLGPTLFIDYWHPSYVTISPSMYYETLMLTYQQILRRSPPGFRPLQN